MLRAMTAENSAEVSSKMKSTVAEIGWSNLESLSSGDDELSGFGSFSDFLALPNGDAVQDQVGNNPAVMNAEQVSDGVDQVKEIHQSFSYSTSRDSVDSWTFNHPVNQSAPSGFHTLSNGGASGHASSDYAQNHQVAGVNLGVVEPANHQPAAVDPVEQVNQMSSDEDLYPGWKFNFEKYQWEQTTEALAVAQPNEGAATQEDQVLSVSAQQNSYNAWENPYPAWTHNHQTHGWPLQPQVQSPSQFQPQVHSQSQVQPQYQSQAHLHSQFHPLQSQFQPQAHLQPEFQSQVHNMHSQFQLQSQYQPQVQSQFHSQAQWQPVDSFATPARPHQEAAGRPAYSCAFSLDGRLVITKPKDPFAVEQVSTIQVYHLNQLGACDLGYGHTNGPLVGNASMKEVIKYVDERIAKSIEDPGQKTLRYLWGALKISCQNYGNIRSSANGPVIGSQDENGALAKLLDPNRNQGFQSFDARGLQPLPSEHQMRATAFEVKGLLISGKRQEALRAAQDGQLWGTALILAQQLGDKFYSDTIALMAQRQFQPGFPLRTLSLLFAGHHTGVFVESSPSNASSFQGESANVATQDAVQGMLDDWEENLAIMAANPTNGDESVIMYLGDCLWKLQNEVFGAHLCYLVANANFEPFSSSSRLCLIGADHSKYPRTYASPEAIQRTELFEFAKVSGNSQFSLLPFQPYKLIYALMLAEAGKVNDALRYCQAVLKTLKTAGNAPDACKEAATALEERLRGYSQGGPVSIMNRIRSGLPNFIHSKKRDNADSNVSTVSRSNSFLVPSASMEPISDNTGRSNMPVRSISEPDFRPAQIDSPGRGASKNPNKNVFSNFVQRAMGLIKTPSKEAKLGDANKFKYDETLKRWVEEGAEAPAEDLILAPPPTTRVASSREEDNGFHAPISEKPVASGIHALTPERPVISGIPPMPPSSNQYSARARQNVRSRYVDTFSKGGMSSAPPKPSESLFLPPTKTASLPPAKFFVPAAQDLTSSINNELAADSTVEDSFKLTSNGPVAFGHPVVQDEELVPGQASAPVSNGAVASSWPAPPTSSYSLAAAMEAPGNSLGTFYSTHQPMAASVVSLPVPPASQTLVDSTSQKEAALIHTDKTAFGDDMQEVEL